MEFPDAILAASVPTLTSKSLEPKWLRTYFPEITFLVWKYNVFARFRDPIINIFPKTVRVKSKQNTCPKKDASITETMSKNDSKIVQKTSKKASKNRSEKQVEKRSKNGGKKETKMKKNRWVRGVRGDPGWNPPAEKQEYCKWVKCKVGCIQN